MTEREMLELAAKAAGITYFDVTPRGVSCENGYLWNPRADDGDAFRLAVKLNMGVSIPVHKTIRADVITFRDPFVNIREKGDDPYAATRLAITRAAAEIGKTMEGEKK